MTQEQSIGTKINTNPEKETKRKRVYVGLCADPIHDGHINIINEAKKYGDVVIGLLTDKAIASYKRLPFMSYEQRKRVVENITGIKEIVPHEPVDYVPNIKKYKPDYVIHGDDWKKGFQRQIRKRVIDTLKKWNGSIIEVPYTKGISSTVYHEELKVIGTTPQLRMRKLRRLLEAKPLVRFLEAHNGLTGLIVEHTKIKRNQVPKEFDGIWISSLTDSTAKGRPDIEFVDLTSRLSTINQILDVTTKPIIVDGDTGGLTEHFSYTIRALERLGISAIIIEDKMGLKRNSLLGISVPQEQDTIENFSKKILTGKKAQVTEDFMIIARIESLILKKGVEDAIKRAKAYIEAGADGIMIHSREKEPDEILDFYNKLENKVPLVAIPTTYSQVTEQELRNAGINIIIYANHLLRSSYLAMKRTAELILSCDRAQEAEQNCLSIDEILKLIPFDNNL